MHGTRLDERTVILYNPMVNQIAAEYGKKYSMVDRQDIKQELWLWFLEHPRKFNSWNEEHNDKDRDKLIAKSLRNAAFDFCLKEKARIGGYDVADVFFYRKSFIKELLPAVLSDDWKRVQNAKIGDSGGQRRPEESGDWMAHAADIRKAYNSLNEEEQNLVNMFYGHDMDSREMHDKIQNGRPTARASAMAANRALNKMVKFLGGYPPRKDNDYSEGSNDNDSRS
jgi:DNA-directed RNA polymerase specialized sigma24 family protein